MPGQQDDLNRAKKKIFGLQWIVFVLILAVLAVSILAFTSPLSEVKNEARPSPTAIDQPDDSIMSDELSPTSENDPSTQRPEDIGYTDGIIFWSTVLILILLVGTMRETIHRKGH